jgi:hypothetical protein
MEEEAYYINCSGARKRKKKIKKKEKVDVFLMKEKVIDFINNKIGDLTSELKIKIKKMSTYKIPYGIDQEDVYSLLSTYDISLTQIKEVTYYDMKIDLEHIKEIKHKIEEYPMKLLYFDSASCTIINKTKTLISTPVKINFFEKKNSSSLTKNEKELESLKKEMISLCKEYIDFSEDIQVDDECDYCGNKDFVENMTEHICTSCGKTKIHIEHNSCYQDNERVSYCQKYKYKKINHFKDTIRQFQGIQNKYINEKVLVELEFALEKDKIINKSLINPFIKLTKEHLRIYLDHTGHNKYYEDINLIYQHFTGKKCPIINQDVYVKILEDFEKLVQMFITISNEDEDKIERTNFLNSQYVLYQLLKKNNYNCSEQDFALPRSIKCRVDQEKIYIMLCEKLHWSYISIL